MKDLKSLLNKLAKEQNFTTAQNQWAKAEYSCVLMNGLLDDLLASSGLGSGYATRRLTAFTELKSRLFDMKMHLEDICDPDLFLVGLKATLEAVLVLIEESVCILSWLGGIQGVVLSVSLDSILVAIRSVMVVIDRPPLLDKALDVACMQIAVAMIAIDGLDILEELGIDEFPSIQIQRVPITCPVSEVWYDEYVLSIAALLGNPDPATLDAIGNILFWLGAALGAIVAAIAWLPAVAAAAAYATLSAALRATAALAIAALGIDQAVADSIVDDLADAIFEECEENEEVVVEEPEKGEFRCCLPEGETFIDDEEGCNAAGGEWMNVPECPIEVVK